MTGSESSMLSDEREFAGFRRQYYGLLVTLFAREPTAEVLDALRADIAERAEAARSLHPQLGAGWDQLRAVLPGLNAESAADEFTRLFIGPFQAEVYPYESWYLTGQLFQAPLIGVRNFLKQVGLERDEKAYPEPEDVLAFELEVMNWLIKRQIEARSSEEEKQWHDRQALFLRRHLLVWAPHCGKDIEAAKSAVLYKGAAFLLQGLLALEVLRFRAVGMEPIETLDQAKRRYGSPRAFQGPLFDPGSPPKIKDAPTSDKNK